MSGPVDTTEDAAVRRFLAERDCVSLGVQTLMSLPVPGLLVNLKSSGERSALCQRLSGAARDTKWQ